MAIKKQITPLQAYLHDFLQHLIQTTQLIPEIAQFDHKTYLNP